MVNQRSQPRSLHFIEKYHRVRSLSDGIGELPTLLVAHVTWRSSDQAGDSKFLHVLGHVNPDLGEGGNIGGQEVKNMAYLATLPLGLRLINLIQLTRQIEA